ncbi:hypothetical protein [Ilumatobacter sp.]|uniref:hypothetical protein n=1 Tax=Ilumatobacter sp. TaxID=1967498 RepID=UPI003B515A8A
MSRYRFAGDVVDSDVTLGLTPGDGPADVTVTTTLTTRLVGPEVADVLHHGRLDGAPWSLATRGDGPGWCMVFGHGCVATMSADRSRIELRVHPDGPDEWIAEVITGWALVYRLAVAGRATFHASTVTLDGADAVAIAGPGHSGKSTMAAAVVALGGSLLGDDVLAAEVDAEVDVGVGGSRVGGSRVGGRGGVVVHSTSSVLKLRGLAQELRRRSTSAPTTTFDGRLAVRADPAPDRARLVALHFLDPAAPAGRRPIDPDEAAVLLVANSKVGTWSWDEASANEFDAACDLADRVPAYVVGRGDGATTVAQLERIAADLFDV